MSNQLIQLSAPPSLSKEDYYQSANSLFHFMKEEEYLYTALSNKALIPRYCLEDINFLKLNIDGNNFNEIAVLQKCFCDIPLHNITSRLPKNSEKEESWDNDHTRVYGEFAIAFSKHWGELNGLQPIQYINDKSLYLDYMRKYIIDSIKSSELSFNKSDAILSFLSFIKPLRGFMSRTIEDKLVKKLKNFYDEQEWRYVPSFATIRTYNRTEKYKINPIIANPKIMDIKYLNQKFVEIQTNIISDKLYRDLWLKFDYNDIRYLIVPNAQSRIDCISFILNLPSIHFNNENDIKIQKSILVSKILVLDEIRKDW